MGTENKNKEVVVTNLSNENSETESKNNENQENINCDQKLKDSENKNNTETDTMSSETAKTKTPPLATKRPLSVENIFEAFEGDEQYQQLKRRKIKVAGAPKMPHTGYVRFMNDRREELRKDFPNKTAVEHTRIIAEEWAQLPEERKAPYIKTADVEKKRYFAELNNFLRENPDILASELAKCKTKNTAASDKNQAHAANASLKAQKDVHKKEMIMPQPVNQPSSSDSRNQNKVQAISNKRRRSPTPNGSSNCQSDTIVIPSPGEIPIFTTEFLEHNKNADAIIKKLRRSKADIEQQNAVLEKHVENMKTGVAKMTVENQKLEEKNRLMEIYLNKLKHKLATALSGLPIPTHPTGPTVDNIEKYMFDLHKMTISNTHGPASLNKAKDIIRKLDLDIQL